jgi:hypothetical protein
MNHLPTNHLPMTHPAMNPPMTHPTKPLAACTLSRGPR